MAKPRKKAKPVKKMTAKLRTKKKAGKVKTNKPKPVKASLTPKKIADLSRKNKLNLKISELFDKMRFPLSEKKQIQAEFNLKAIAKYVEENPNILLGIPTVSSIFERLGDFYNAGKVYERHTVKGKDYYFYFAGQQYLKDPRLQNDALRMPKILERKFVSETKAKIKSDPRYLKWSHWIYNELALSDAKRIEKLMKKHKII